MRRFVTSDGAELAFEDNGRGRIALLFVHGWQADRSVWRDVVEALDADVRTIGVDLRGSGDSNAASGPYTLERIAADLRELVDALGPAPVVVVGHSMGATVALRLAVDSPHVVRALVLIAPIPASGAALSENGEAFLRTTPGDPIAVRAWLMRTLANPSDGQTLDRLCASAAKASREALLQGFPSWTRAHFAEETKAIAAPTLVIAPENDRPEATSARVAGLIEGSRYALMPHAAHYVIVEHPKEVAKLIDAFIEEIEAARR